MQIQFEDPRRRGDFLPQFYPSANGKDAPPPDSTDRNDRITLEFLAVYYDLNCAYSKLVESRTVTPDATGEGADCDTRGRACSPREAVERELLQAIEKLLVIRDGLEDDYAPFGVIAEPFLREGFTVDVKLGFGNVDSRGKPRSEVFTITARVPVPLPPGARIEDYIESVEGPEPFFRP